MTREEFIGIVQVLKEERNKEFKCSTPWNAKAFKCKITKSVLGLSNLRDGGYIIFGVKQEDNGGFSLEGMTDADFDTYRDDDIASFVAEYADPFVQTDLSRVEYDGKKFIVLNVNEFEEIPVICRKDGIELRRGALYTRSTRMPETVEVPTQTEMREILELAVTKNVRRFFKMQSAAGLSFLPSATDAELFRQQREDLL